jgi:hypothetical protein
MLKVYAVGEARQVVKARLKAANEKPSHWPSAAISKLALAHVYDHWPEFKALALAKIMRTPALKAEWDAAGAKYDAQMARRRKPKAA